MWADNKVVLNYLLGNTGDIRWLPSKHIDIRPQEGNERAFLFVINGGADGETLDLLLFEHSGTSSTGAVHSERARFLDSLLEVLLPLEHCIGFPLKRKG